MWRALLAARSPPRLRRWRLVRPDDWRGRGCPAQVRERCLRPEPFGVVAGGDEELARRFGPDSEQRDQFRGGLGDQGPKLGVGVV